ncbi:ABC transporter permease [Nocardia seriolae]|uniref:ABC transporter permease n=1 Tax=Nocardia seriolae TaxID=37332 RepID=UPI00051A8387|nr:ABC transporter permease subunit [Nocardia seriolae]MTJ64006.1 ABC transporter permease subunit [Nocardia seriolae]MTJ71326.1 ABC transporter permease subunit [Nocardia seriolae]MTJ88567.1 ABC transporter permease subunit [Nocardia seriolae]MTK32551.1 ABC transporter permease subunit [Nocardia seriolae]MTK41892.1 ABC transporter permease subunit [Nocardia seriolae]
MFSTVYLRCLRDQRRGLIGWSIGLVALVLLESALWPSISRISGLKQLLDSYPESLRKLFAIDEFTSGTGFLNTELYSMMLPILFLVFAISRGARAIAGEEESGTLEVLLITRVTPVRLLLEQSAVLLTGLTALGTVLFVAVIACSAVFGMHVGLAAAATGSVAMIVLAAPFGALALAVGSATGRRLVALAIASVAAVGAYVLYAASKIVESVRPWGPWSPFQQALADGPMGGGLRLGHLWLIVLAVAFVAAALPVFDRRDVRAV